MSKYDSIKKILTRTAIESSDDVARLANKSLEQNPESVEKSDDILKTTKSAIVSSGKGELSALPFGNSDLDNPAIIGEALLDLLKMYEKHVNAPIRKGITEKISGKSLDKAPTGKEQAQMLGIPTDEYGIRGVDWLPTVSPAGAVGFGLELLQDPTMYLGPLSSGVAAGASKLSKVKPAVTEAIKQTAIPLWQFPESQVKNLLSKGAK